MDESDKQYSDAVLQAVAAGQKVKVIKVVREITGLGLKEAKHEIDQLMAEHPSSSPTMAEEGGSGAIIKIIVGALVLLAIYRLLFDG